MKTSGGAVKEQMRHAGHRENAAVRANAISGSRRGAGMLVMLAGLLSSLTVMAASTSTVTFTGKLTSGTCSVGVIGGVDTLTLTAPQRAVEAVTTAGGEVAGVSASSDLEVDCSQVIPSATQGLVVQVESTSLAAGDTTLAYDATNAAGNRGLGVSLRGPDNPAGVAAYYKLGAPGAPETVKTWAAGTLPDATTGNNVIPLKFYLRRADVTQKVSASAGFPLAALTFTAQIP